MSKDKEHKRYEFGSKVSITTKRDSKIIVGSMAFGTNKFDVHTLPEVLLQKRFRKQAGIEPVIGYLKSDHRLNRSYFKGFEGDQINVLMAAAAFNFRKWMRFFYWPRKRLPPGIV
tara:strand:- start:35 stop:379 length:345 start_codon:yes stop_codon:yes gene_type:complete